jgi:hypothetical protein
LIINLTGFLSQYFIIHQNIFRFIIVRDTIRFSI